MQLRACVREIERRPLSGRRAVLPDLPDGRLHTCGTWLIAYAVRGGDIYIHTLEFVGF